MLSDNESPDLGRRRIFRKKFSWCRLRRRAFDSFRLVWRGNVLFAALRFIDMFLLNLRSFAEVMFLAGTTENQRGSGNCSGDFARPKMHNAPGQ